MNKYLKVLAINTILCLSLIYNFQNNISYAQDNNINMLIEETKKEESINEKIADLEYIIDSKKEESYKVSITSVLQKKINLTLGQIQMFKGYLQKQLTSCEKKQNLLIQKIKKEKEDILVLSNTTYIKGIWPLENYKYISSNYGYRTHPITKKLNFHTGIDIPAPKNTNVLASDDGIVSFCGEKNGYGNVVEITHFDNKTTLYAHNNYILVNAGDVVKRGQAIAKVGSTGNSTGDHVHFEVKVNNQRINPIYCISNK